MSHHYLIHMVKRITLSVLGIVLFTSPLMLSADQISDLQAQIASLTAQMSQLRTTQTSAKPLGISVLPHNQKSSVSCPKLTAFLAVGSKGAEVSALQEFLTAHLNLQEDIITGYFGPKTIAYVKQFQAKRGIEQVGQVGKLTREAIARTCGTLPVTATATTPAIRTASSTTTSLSADDQFMRSLHITDTVVGTGPAITQDGQGIIAAWTGTLPDGTLFWDSRQKEQFKNGVFNSVYSVALNASTTNDMLQIIWVYPKAVRVGLMGMRAGGERDIQTSAGVAFGYDLKDPVTKKVIVPKDTLVTFHVKLSKVEVLPTLTASISLIGGGANVFENSTTTVRLKMTGLPADAAQQNYKVYVVVGKPGGDAGSGQVVKNIEISNALTTSGVEFQWHVPDDFLYHRCNSYRQDKDLDICTLSVGVLKGYSSVRVIGAESVPFTVYRTSDSLLSNNSGNSGYKTSGTVNMVVGTMFDVWGGNFWMRLDSISNNVARFSFLTDNSDWKTDANGKYYYHEEFEAPYGFVSVPIGQQTNMILTMHDLGSRAISASYPGTITFNRMLDPQVGEFTIVMDSKCPCQGNKTANGTIDRESLFTTSTRFVISGSASVGITHVDVHVVPASYMGSTDIASLGATIKGNGGGVSNMGDVAVNGRWSVPFSGFRSGTYKVYVFDASSCATDGNGSGCDTMPLIASATLQIALSTTSTVIPTPTIIGAPMSQEVADLNAQVMVLLGKISANPGSSEVSTWQKQVTDLLARISQLQ